jgi:hypothetical protein
LWVQQFLQTSLDHLYMGLTIILFVSFGFLGAVVDVRGIEISEPFFSGPVVAISLT